MSKNVWREIEGTFYLNNGDYQADKHGSIDPPDKDNDVGITIEHANGETDYLYIPFDVMAAYVDFHRLRNSKSCSFSGLED